VRCQRHPHSSEATAQKCWAEWVGKRGDRVLKNLLQQQPPRYIQVRCMPPETVFTGTGVPVLYFFRAERVLSR
jgi:uncharacterized protein GlcG (DUF336 family)